MKADAIALPLSAASPASAWPFERSELTAALRRHLSAPDLIIERVWDAPLPSRPAVGSIRGLRVSVLAGGEQRELAFVLKQPQGATRTGLAGVGRREIGLYERLAIDLPVKTPTLVAAARDGSWLVLEMLEPGPAPESWTAENYTRAVYELATVHDRFWGLGEDLAAFPWLGRPLAAEYEVYIMAAATAFESLVFGDRLALITSDPDHVTALSRLISQADKVASVLRAEPQTLVHGDYWPGNIDAVNPTEHVVFDWQLVGIGPGVLDLVAFVTKSRWWFGALPLSPAQLVRQYRGLIADRTGRAWSDDAWARVWDYALMWNFATEWLGLLAAAPPALIQTRREALESVWLQPVLAAIGRRLEKWSVPIIR